MSADPQPQADGITEADWYAIRQQIAVEHADAVKRCRKPTLPPTFDTDTYLSWIMGRLRQSYSAGRHDGMRSAEAIAMRHAQETIEAERKRMIKARR